MKKIKRAIISVSDKEGLPELVKVLSAKGVEIFSTGGTLKAILETGVEAKSIESYTKFPEMLDGRVKTLHPKIHGGILARRDKPDHLASLKEYEILEFDLVCINLYPFEKVIRSSEFSFEEAIENIDIGGPSMIRAAAKNYNDVTVLTDSSQYHTFIERFNENDGNVSPEFRFDLAVQAFNRTGAYDSIISNYLNNLQGDYLSNTQNLTVTKMQDLRYGENPHQKGAFYAPTLNKELPWKNLHGKELSYNNLLDLDSALNIICDFNDPICAIFKHTNPCGVSMGKSQVENLKAAMKADPVSYFGGIAAFNQELTLEAAEIIHKEFFEIIVAPSFSKEAFELLTKKKNIRLVEVPSYSGLKHNPLEIKSAAHGFLIQESDLKAPSKEELKIVTKAKPTDDEINEMLFGFELVKHIKSNAIVFTKDRATVGVGAGQMSRLDSMKIAVEKAKEFGLTTEGSYMASDAFFPFRDAVDVAIKAGVKGIIQPGGSMRDEESIGAADEAGIIMIMTGIRHFKH